MEAEKSHDLLSEVGCRPRKPSGAIPVQGQEETHAPAQGVRQREDSPTFYLFVPIRPSVDWMKLTPLWEGTLPPPIQMIMSSRNTLPDTPRITYNQTAGRLKVQLGWYRKLTIVRSFWVWGPMCLRGSPAWSWPGHCCQSLPLLWRIYLVLLVLRPSTQADKTETHISTLCWETLGKCLSHSEPHLPSHLYDGDTDTIASVVRSTCTSGWTSLFSKLIFIEV